MRRGRERAEGEQINEQISGRRKRRSVWTSYSLCRDLYHLPPLAKSVNNGRNEADAFMNK